jgi:septal ring factor EnvC (AmiA/AmiB activator)
MPGTPDQNGVDVTALNHIPMRVHQELASHAARIEFIERMLAESAKRQNEMHEDMRTLTKVITDLSTQVSILASQIAQTKQAAAAPAASTNPGIVTVALPATVVSAVITFILTLMFGKVAIQNIPTVQP